MGYLAKAVIAQRAQDVLSHVNYFSKANSNFLSLPDSIQLGMSDVPVLDQGSHGTCATFAVSGAVDAVIAKGDYVSQLCLLQLGTYLAKQGKGRSGWDGAFAFTVLKRMEEFGVVNKDKQHSVGCGGYYHYPSTSSIPDSSYMESSQFLAISEPVIGKRVAWSNIPASLTYNSDPAKTLQNVKQALNEGSRVIFATMLPRTDLGNAGAVGKHNTWFDHDSWVLSAAILADAKKADSAHELIITGYDDNAVAVDSDGVTHKGLLTLRNSWGRWSGYWGEFYMSYDYFKLLSFDAKRVSSIKS